MQSIGIAGISRLELDTAAAAELRSPKRSAEIAALDAKSAQVLAKIGRLA